MGVGHEAISFLHVLSNTVPVALAASTNWIEKITTTFLGAFIKQDLVGIFIERDIDVRACNEIPSVDNVSSYYLEDNKRRCPVTVILTSSTS